MVIKLDEGSELTEPLLWGESNDCPRKPERHAELIKKINAKNAKYVAFSLVLGFILYHGIIHLRYGSDSCKWLLSDGRYKGDMEWQPYGCMMHRYSQTDTRRCMRYLAFWGRHNHFVFIGDSRVHQMYLAFIDHLTGHKSQPQTTPSNHSLYDEQLRLTVDFFWSPSASDVMVNMFHHWAKANPPPSMVVAGSAAWSTKFTNSTAKAVEEYTFNLTRLVTSMNTIVESKGQVFWALQEPVITGDNDRDEEANTQIDLYNRAAMEVIQQSSAKVWSSCRLVAQTRYLGKSIYVHDTQMLLNTYCNDHMNYNVIQQSSAKVWSSCRLVAQTRYLGKSIYVHDAQMLLNVIQQSSAKVWSSCRLVAQTRYLGKSIYVHDAQMLLNVIQQSSAKVWSSCRLVAQTRYLGKSIYVHDTQMLLNTYCNDHMNYNDGTCCSSAEPHTSLQVVTAAVFGVCLVLACAMTVKRKLQGSRADPPSPVYVLSTNLAKLGLIMAYFYLCDRTNFFMKENKYYSPVSFWLPIGYVFALGLFFTEDSRYTKVLHRDQTDEWKGWMILVYLIYNMTGASTNLQIYNHIRVLISAYLFISGYGHFYYLWHRNDAGIVRFFQVLFRLNMLVVVLCLCMNRPYQFYQFVPVVSFWFTLLYLVLIAPPRVTQASCEHNHLHYLYLVLKFVGLFSFIIMLYMSEVFFDKVFVTRPWKALFVTTDDDIHDWWFRWKLDRYSTSYGAVFGMLLLVAQSFSLVDDNNHSNLFTSRIALCSVFLAFVGIGCSTTFDLLCQSKAECNEVHSYTVAIPIVSYIFLRNVSGILRTRYSSFFAWFGRLSLELMVTPYHVWLAADNHGVLVLLPGYPVLNVLVSCYIMVCITHELHTITRRLLPFAVPNDWRLVLRNVGLFLMVLIPIGIHDGMF
ncbi:N-acetylneuraminate 9-O-acetyltransferase-like [Macrosteles quadrilineatus]|uniref:N-acetylneuraminate 9-O-acetyltransferase-like n=1 Tax=Macrosteles quadrilineatus TaxID=74068 RepID=UPI0023E2E9F5|nr:N-acetylneuraminate 9-O-acetyltransferase-like [Macrosteles quadrilineatus]